MTVQDSYLNESVCEMFISVQKTCNDAEQIQSNKINGRHKAVLDKVVCLRFRLKDLFYAIGS